MRPAGVVLAAGKGVRMGSALPKVLHEVAGVPMVSHVVGALRAGGIGDVVVVAGHGAAQVRQALSGEKGVRFALQRRQRGTADALACARAALGGARRPIVVACGDAPLVRAETVRALLSARRASGAYAVVGTLEVADPAGYGRVVREPDGQVFRIVEEREATEEERRLREVNSGLYAFRSPEVFADLRQIRPSAVRKELYLTEAVRIARSRGERVEALRAEDPAELLGVNTPVELSFADRAMRQRVAAVHLAAGVRIADAGLVSIDAGVSIGAGTVIFPFTVIRRGVRIGRGCQVGPFAHLRGATVLADGAEIGNFVEVKAGRIGPGTKAKHLAYLGDVTIGRGANIGAGTIVANYDGKRKWPTVIGDRAFVGSGAILVAPVRVGKAALVGAGAVVTRGRNVPPGGVVAGVPARPLKKRPS